MTKAPGTFNGRIVHQDVYIGTEGNNDFGTALSYNSSDDSYTYYGTQYGLDGVDVLRAGLWDSKLYGGNDGDILFGGAGKDRLYGEGGGDTIVAIGMGDTVDGGEGFDNASIDLSSLTTDVSAQFAGAGGQVSDSIHLKSVEAIILTTGSGSDFITVSQVFNASISTQDGNDVVVFVGPNGGPDRSSAYGGGGTDRLVIDFGGVTTQVSMTSESAFRWEGAAFETELIYGGFENFTFTGGAAADSLTGSFGDDILTGGKGSDYLGGGDGADILDGGAGIDSVDVNFRYDSSITFDARFAASAGGASLADGTQVRNAEIFSLTMTTGDDHVVLGAYGDILYCDNGDDTATVIGSNFGTEFDRIYGGYGIDRLILDFSSATTGVQLGSTYAQRWTGTEFEKEVEARDFEAFTLTGGDGDDALAGGSYNDVLSGGKGDDYLGGGSGIEILDGGVGIDLIEISFQYDAAITFDARLAGTAAGTVLADGTQVRNAEIFSLTMTTGDDHVVLGAYADILYCDNGDDTATVIGSNFGTEFDRIYGGYGIDRLVLDFGGATTGVQLGSTYAQRWTGTAFEKEVEAHDFEVFTFTGGDGDDALAGGFYDDVLSGGKGADQLDGGAGADSLDGGRGADSLYGGDANDTYWVDDAGDTVVEFVNQGEDTVVATLKAYTLGANLENAILAGAGDFALTGNTGANRLLGNAGANKISGGDGQDSLDGAGGADILNGGEQADTLIGGLGADRLTGGKGDDTFLYLSSQDSTAAQQDIITDLKGADVVDLTGIDADSIAAGDQAFHQVAAFSGARGELTLTFASATGRTTLAADITGDGLADFMLQIEGSHLSAAGWLL